MTPLFSRQNAEVLTPLGQGRVLLAFDFDGTLAPIVKNRDAAHMRPETAKAFQELCRLAPCAVISGRSLADLQPRLQNAKVQHVVGNHGLEYAKVDKRFEKETSELRRLLSRTLNEVAGVEIEDKRFSLSVHFRLAPKKSIARRAILEALKQVASKMRVVPGKDVFNVVSRRAPHKGHCLLHLRRLHGHPPTLFIGDDVTDEDVFRLKASRRLVTVRIGQSAQSKAQYYLRSQHDMDLLLHRLIQLIRR